MPIVPRVCLTAEALMAQELDESSEVIGKDQASCEETRERCEF